MSSSTTTDESRLLSQTQFKKQWTRLLCSALESWTHQLLYTRRVYPRSSFRKNSFLGIRCFVSRHPDVVSYITNTLQVAVPSLVAGVGNELAFTIFDQQEDSAIVEELETYLFRFKSIVQDEKYRVDIRVIHQLERNMRDLVLAVLTMESSSYPTNSDTVSFRLSMHVPEENTTCPLLNEAFATGTWHVPAETNGSGQEVGHGRVVIPLREFSMPSVCSVHFLKRKVAKAKLRKKTTAASPLV